MLEGRPADRSRRNRGRRKRRRLRLYGKGESVKILVSYCCYVSSVLAKAHIRSSLRIPVAGSRVEEVDEPGCQLPGESEYESGGDDEDAGVYDPATTAILGGGIV